MAQITPQMVKDLREKTGAGMGDCKKALVENDGNMESAIEFLRKKGAASAAKRADRAAKEGNIIANTSDDGKIAAIVEVNCETDFVAKNAEFEEYVNTVTNALLNNEAADLDALLALSVGDDTINGLHNGILAKFSEKIEIRRFERLKSDGFISSYVHAGNKLAVVVEISFANPSDNSKTMLRDIAMQIAAMNPQFISRDEVSSETMDKEKEIYRQVAIDEGKPADIADRIANGKLEKFFQESCLLEQTFVKDSTKTVKDIVKEISKDCGTEVKIVKFLRYFLGEE